MHDNSPRDHFDDVIDDTARSMTDGVPRASLREGVRARIERPSSSPFRTGVPMWQLGLAAASIAVIALVVGQNVSGPPDPSSPSALDMSVEPRPTGEQVIAATPPDVTRPALIPVPERGAPGADGPRTRAAASVTSLAAPELIAIEPLDVDPIGPQLMAVDSMPDSMPIVIEPLRVEPLSME